MKIFLSYTRSKDQFEDVSTFRKHFAVEIEMRVPGSTIFQDTENIGNGDHFPEILKKEISSSDVLLIMLSPAWLLSDWCRHELNLFTNNLTDQQKLHKILPVLWVTTPQITQQTEDPIAKTLASINYADWREVRYGPWEGANNKREVGNLAEQITNLGIRSFTHIATKIPGQPQNNQPTEATAALERIERLMPSLLIEMRTDLTSYPLQREFVLLKRSWNYWAKDNELIYYFDDHDDLEAKLRILENLSLVQEITYNNVKRYILSEELAKYLGAP